MVRIHKYLMYLMIFFMTMECIGQKNSRVKEIDIITENIPLKFFVKKKDNEVIFSTTGFFVNYKSKLYIVTARHSIKDSTDSFRGSVLTIFQYSNFLQNIQLDFSLDGSKLDNVYPIYEILEDKRLDLAILYTGEFDPKGNIFSFDIEKETINIDSLKVTQEVILIGYPFSLVDNRYYLDFRPILRKGIISTINYKENYFVSDVLSTFGDSGSPIICIDNNCVCGVLIRSIGKKGHLGFSEFVSINVVADLIKKFHVHMNFSN